MVWTILIELGLIALIVAVIVWAIKSGNKKSQD